MICAACFSNASELAYKSVVDWEYGLYKPVDFYRCSNCGLLYQSPLPNLESIISFYPDNYRNYQSIDGNGIFAFLKRIQFRNHARKFSKFFPGYDSRILEIGCGNGELSVAIKNIGYKNIYACDFSDRAKSKLNANEIDFRIANIEDGIPYEANFDVILLNNVIEHLADPVKVIENCFKRLDKDGVLLLATPNGGALDLSIFKKFWVGFHAPRHLYIFGKKSFVEIASRLGFSGCEFYDEADPGQWALSIQNILQANSLTKVTLKNGMAFYTVILVFLFVPVAILQNFLGKSTSLIALMKK